MQETVRSRLHRRVPREFPKFRIVESAPAGFRASSTSLLKVLTFGAQREFMTRYHTVLWDLLYVPDRWEAHP